MSRTNRALPLPIRASRIDRGRAVRGFTLIELLVVLVIILVLIGILVPALSSSRNTARRVASQSQLKGISAAIESYATTFNTYPGYISEADVHSAKDEFTSTENLVLSLMGGPDPTLTSAPSAPDGRSISTSKGDKYIDHQLIGRGPKMTNGRKVDAFYAAKPDELQVIGDAAADKYTPELIDTTSGMPILYYRAVASGTVPVGEDYPAGGKFAVDNNSLYLQGMLTASENRSADQTLSLINESNNDRHHNLSWLVTNQKLSNVPTSPAKTDANGTDDVVAGKYVLISPGVDGIYFSQDQLGDGTATAITGYDQLGAFDDVVHVGGQ